MFGVPLPPPKKKPWGTLLKCSKEVWFSVELSLTTLTGRNRNRTVIVTVVLFLVECGAVFSCVVGDGRKVGASAVFWHKRVRPSYSVK